MIEKAKRKDENSDFKPPAAMKPYDTLLKQRSKKAKNNKMSPFAISSELIDIMLGFGKLI